MPASLLPHVRVASRGTSGPTRAISAQLYRCHSSHVRHEVATEQRISDSASAGKDSERKRHVLSPPDKHAQSVIHPSLQDFTTPATTNRIRNRLVRHERWREQQRRGGARASTGGGSDDSDWRRLVSVLERRADSDIAAYTKHQVILDFPDVDPKIAGLYDPSRLFLAIRYKYRCSVTFMPENDPLPETERRVLLKGTSHAIEYAIKTLSRVYGSYEKVETTSDVDAEAEAMIRGTLNNTITGKGQLAGLLLDRIPFPEKLNVLTFTAYVRSLVRSEPAIQAARNRWAHVSKVADLLVQAFDRTDVQNYSSPESAVEAIQYLQRYMKHGQARQIADHFGNPTDMDPSDIDLATVEPAVLRGDLKAFIRNISELDRHRHHLSPLIWLSLLRLMKHRNDTDAVLSIVSTMRRTGLLDLLPIRLRVLENIIAPWYSSWREQGKSPAEFIKTIDTIYADTHWLTPDALIGIMTHHAHRGEFDTAAALLKKYSSRGGHIPVAVLEMLVKAAGRSRNVEAAVGVVGFVLEAQRAPKISQAVYKGLFNTARRRGFLYVAATVWIHACLSGFTDAGMRRFVTYSALRATRHDEQGSSQGTDPFTEESEDEKTAGIAHRRRRYVADNLAALVASQVVVTVRHESEGTLQRRLTLGTWLQRQKRGDAATTSQADASLLVRAFMTQSQRLVASKPFQEALAEAYERDMQVKDAAGKALNGMPGEEEVPFTIELEVDHRVRRGRSLPLA